MEPEQILETISLGWSSMFCTFAVPSFTTESRAADLFNSEVVFKVVFDEIFNASYISIVSVVWVTVEVALTAVWRYSPRRDEEGCVSKILNRKKEIKRREKAEKIK